MEVLSRTKQSSSLVTVFIRIITSFTINHFVVIADLIIIFLQIDILARPSNFVFLTAIAG